MTTAYFDCFSGVSGDMLLGALIDAGADLASIQGQLAALHIDGCSLQAERINKQGLAATRVTVPGETQQGSHHRSFETIRGIIEESPLSAAVQQRAVAVFRRLAEAEAKVHDCPVERVHFHEVGAVDALTDIIGAAIALENLGVQRVVCSPIATGSGTVTCAHGILPVPAPATAELLKGVPLAACDEVGELATPTGVAFLTTVADSYGPPPAMTIERVGYGAGRREGRSRPNVLRVMLGTGHGDSHTDLVTVLEANIDDATPEVVGYCTERLLEAGALDVYCVPIYMKKSRPAVLLAVLAEPHRVAELEEILFTETTTLGIRRHDVHRSTLARSTVRVETPFGPVRVKVSRRGGQIMTAAPEYDDCREAARQHGVALRAVMEAAAGAWRAQADQ
ncbi:MAG TPA: nickel pincer cofactor biosynthesis protein LarC [Phycisphaerae bacterium]|nr:nickel pincer cofactor biosynthesis protein LarC [Phycisphaerae bacterium]